VTSDYLHCDWLTVVAYEYSMSSCLFTS